MFLIQQGEHKAMSMLCSDSMAVVRAEQTAVVIVS